MNKSILELERKEYLTNIKSLINEKEYEQLQEKFKVLYTFDAISMQGTNKVSIDEVKKSSLAKRFLDTANVMLKRLSTTIKQLTTFI